MTTVPSSTSASLALEQASQWVIRHSDTQSDGQTCAEFDAWYQADARHAQAYDRLARLWRRMGDINGSVLRKRPARKKCRPAVAALILAVLGGYYGYAHLPPHADYASGTQLAHVVLPDGSIAVLDADTAIAVNYRDGQRDVQLIKGRAFFEPSTRKPGMAPFVVSTPQANATALGTRYVVSVLEAGSTYVEVYEHQVSVTCMPCGPDSTTTLSTGEAVAISSAGLSQIQASGGHASAPDWSQGLMSFDNVPLTDVVTQLSRYSGKYILVLGETARSQYVSGVARVVDPQRALALLLAQSKVRIRELPGLLILQ